MKLAALVPFEFHEPQFGGAERIYELLTRIEAPVYVLAPSPEPDRVVKVKNLTIQYRQLPEWVRTSPHYDINLASVAKEIFRADLDEFNPDLVILEHPWQVEAVEGYRFVYDAHNNETAMKRQILPDEAERTAELEAKALQAEHVFYCAETDNIEAKAKTLIPNGTNLPDVSRMNGSLLKTVLFVGSAHPPNIAAAMMLAGLAKAIPEYTVVIAGACSFYIQNPPDNVRLVGHLSPAALDFVFCNASVFVNLMTAGSGTSLKIAKALSYGMPVISSELGARGYENYCIIAPNAESVIKALHDLTDQKAYKQQSEIARGAAHELDWDIIGKRYSDTILGLA